MYMLINIKLKKSNFSEVRDLTKKFELVCSKLCDKTKNIEKRLKDIEVSKKNN